jgi:hypothetical protein
MWLMPTADGAKLISQGGVKIYNLPGINYPVNRGERGKQGEIGPQGSQGIQGIQGQKGDKGDPGDLVIESDCNCPKISPQMPVIESIFLSEPYPNPSLISSSIDYNISSDYYNEYDYSTSFIVFYDITGLQRLRLLLVPSAGSLEINQSLLGTGTFLYRIETTNGFSEVRKLIFD